MAERRLTPDADAVLLVLASAQQVADLHRQLRHSAAWRVPGERPRDPAGAEAALAGLRALREEALDHLADAVRAPEDAAGLEEQGEQEEG